MIKFYYRQGCGSSQKAKSWFEKYKINVDMKRIGEISKQDLQKILSYMDGGIETITKRSSMSNPQTQNSLEMLLEMNLDEGLEYLSRNAYLLRSPIVLDENKVQVGYNMDDLRQFFPREYRRLELATDQSFI
ncbi:ArsC/Spx/MgsR family protein [Lactococcus petauri]|uniref:ArsC/Spx/MgsR family protein n=1 Tax=Lactococcus petauri TaxID=1940789 RepID=UPI0032B75A6C